MLLSASLFVFCLIHFFFTSLMLVLLVLILHCMCWVVRSAGFSDVDEKGLQHMVLCRVIMGNMEQVPLGSEQFCPSSDGFDSGVDDLRNPRRYIIWGTHMNTHIHPEYVVSFKVPPVEGNLGCET